MKKIFSNFKGDTFGGIIALPLALAFGVSSCLRRMQYMDQSGLYAMEDMLQDLKTKNVMVLFVNLLKQPKYMMERIDIIPDFIPKKHIFDSFAACTNWIKKKIREEKD